MYTFWGSTVIDLCEIRKLQTALRSFENELKNKTSLSLNDALCLCSISQGVSEPGQLARELQLSPSRLTRILDALEKRKYVERQTASGDRRGVLVSLTVKGKKTIKEYSCAGLEVPAELLHTQEAR